jgi:peptidoglycan hydrolase CwlO-like protein
MVRKKKNKPFNLERLSMLLTSWVGTPQSIIAHSIFFVAIFGLRIFNFSTSDILLILTTAVSLEAIYLAIFIQMTVNKQSQSLKSVEEDIDEIQEDVEDLQEDVEDIQEDVEEDDVVDENTKVKLEKIEAGLQILLKEIESIKRTPN